MMNHAFTAHAGQPAASSMGKTTSFSELHILAERVTAWLQSQGVSKGDRVALMMPNVLPFMASVVAVLRAGGVVVTINPMYTPRELQHQLKDSGAQTIIILDAFAPTLDAVLKETPLKNIVVIPTGMVPADSYKLPGHISFMDVVQAGAALQCTAVSVGPDDIAFLQYTGGTTGVSKGAVLLHRNVVANVAQMAAWVQPAVGTNPAGMRIVSMLPLYHIFALTFCLLYGLHKGLHNYLIANPRDLPGTIKSLEGVKLNIFPAVNTLFAGLMATENFKSLDLSELRVAVGGGASVFQAVADRWLAATGIPIIEGYGLSETSPMVSCNLTNITEWTGTIGLYPFAIPSLQSAMMTTTK